MLIALCLVMLVAATTGGGLAFAQSINTPSPQFVETAVSISSAENMCCDVGLEAPARAFQLMPAAPSGPCSVDCNGLIPNTANTSGSGQVNVAAPDTSILLALVEALQLPPPRA
ncbi:MAG: hypothetical protein AB8B88_04860 [Devosiaceae bacterium]